MVLHRWNLKRRREGWGSFRLWRWNMRMRMKEMEKGGKMGEMGKMGERKSIGSFYMRVGIFVSMYLTSLSLFPSFRSREEK